MCHQMPFWCGIRCKTFFKFLEDYVCGCGWAVPDGCLAGKQWQKSRVSGCCAVAIWPGSADAKAQWLPARSSSAQTPAQHCIPTNEDSVTHKCESVDIKLNYEDWTDFQICLIRSQSFLQKPGDSDPQLQGTTLSVRKKVVSRSSWRLEFQIVSEQLSENRRWLSECQIQFSDGISRLVQRENYNSRSDSQSDSWIWWQLTWGILICPEFLKPLFPGPPVAKLNIWRRFGRLWTYRPLRILSIEFLPDLILK